eukprot:SM000035S13101  [mRNA]  locus=s35:459048:462873:+ [translate_table: standard]
MPSLPADVKYHRLQAYLFGAEKALEDGNASQVYSLSLRLLSFLECESRSHEDRVYLDPIRRRCYTILDTARQREQKTRNPAEQAGLADGSKLQITAADIISLEDLNLLDEVKVLLNSDSTLADKLQVPEEAARTSTPAAQEPSSCTSRDSDTEATPGIYFRAARSKRGRPSDRTKASSESTLHKSSGPIMATFMTASEKLTADAMRRPKGMQKGQCKKDEEEHPHVGQPIRATAVGLARRGTRGNFNQPTRTDSSQGAANLLRGHLNNDNTLEESTLKCLEQLAGPDGELPGRLRNLEPRLLEHVSNEIMQKNPNTTWDDIAGLEHAKRSVYEAVIMPLLAPHLFTGVRSAPKGLLLFGPPGTGKTLIGKAIASNAKATFFSISASSMTSKWIGEGEKLVRALFGVAACHQPAVIFIDEIDSLLCQRKSDGEHESSRRLKTQFLIEMEGCSSGDDKILLIGATNRPQELDEAARRRLAKKLYIPLPTAEARGAIIKNLLVKDKLLNLSEAEVAVVAEQTEGYSGSDMKNLVQEASMVPLRDAITAGLDLASISTDEMRAISAQDFAYALQQVRRTVAPGELEQYELWNQQFGGITS